MNRSSSDVRRPLRLPELLFAQFGAHRNALLEWQPVAFAGSDPEGVHKMRIETRRLRMLLRTFCGLYPKKTEHFLLTELQWIAEVLGRARDADVCEIEVHRIRNELEPDDSLIPYCRFLRQLNADAHNNLQAALQTNRYAQLIEALSALDEQHARTKVTQRWRGKSLKQEAVQRVGLSARRVRRRGRAITANASATDYHRLRIAAKKLRYLLDFFAVAQPRKWRQPIAALSQLQDLLGEQQDAVTARDRHLTFANTIQLTDDNRQLLLTMGRLLQLETDRIQTCRAAFPKVWSKYRRSIRDLLPS